MKHYSKFGVKKFIIAAGYKSKVIKNYFKKKFYNWEVKIVDTGLNTMTGGRLKRLKKLKEELINSGCEIKSLPTFLK